MAAVVEVQVVVNAGDSAAKLGAVSAEVESIGTASTAATAQVGQSMTAMTGHIARPLDGVRLMSQEFGLRMPRALEAMASRVPAITGMISGMMGAFTVIAVAEILYRIGEAAFKAFDIGGAGARAMTKAVADTNFELRGMNDSLNVQIGKL